MQTQNLTANGLVGARLDALIEQEAAARVGGTAPATKKQIGRPSGGRVALLVNDEPAPRAATDFYDRYPKVPSASTSGRQQGVPPPSQRTITAGYEAVTLAEAEARARARRHGAAPIIAGGIDDLEAASRGEPVGAVLGADQAEQPVRPAATFDVPIQPPVRRVLLAEAAPQSASPAQQSAPAPLPTLRQTKRVTFTFENGTYSMPCVDVKEGPSGLMILLQADPNSATFVPAGGSRFTVGLGGKSWRVFYPGLYFELPELGLIAMSLLLDPKQEG